MRSYVPPFIDWAGRIVGYGVYDLRDLQRCDWRLSERNVWAVERALNGNRGHRLATADDDFRRWRVRFLRFCDRHPGKKPLDYHGRDRWMSSGPRIS